MRESCRPRSGTNGKEIERNGLRGDEACLTLNRRMKQYRYAVYTVYGAFSVCIINSGRLQWQAIHWWKREWWLFTRHDDDVKRPDEQFGGRTGRWGSAPQADSVAAGRCEWLTTRKPFTVWRHIYSAVTFEKTYATIKVNKNSKQLRCWILTKT